MIFFFPAAVPINNKLEQIGTHSFGRSCNPPHIKPRLFIYYLLSGDVPLEASLCVEWTINQPHALERLMFSCMRDKLWMGEVKPSQETKSRVGRREIYRVPFISIIEKSESYFSTSFVFFAIVACVWGGYLFRMGFIIIFRSIFLCNHDNQLYQVALLTIAECTMPNLTWVF